MTASQHLDQARRALLTDQPTVAMLHMQRAREESVIEAWASWYSKHAALGTLPTYGGVA